MRGLGSCSLIMCYADRNHIAVTGSAGFKEEGGVPESGIQLGRNLFRKKLILMEGIYLSDNAKKSRNTLMREGVTKGEGISFTGKQAGKGIRLPQLKTPHDRKSSGVEFMKKNRRGLEEFRAKSLFFFNATLT